jgi:hypothetical protein
MQQTTKSKLFVRTSQIAGGKLEESLEESWRKAWRKAGGKPGGKPEERMPEERTVLLVTEGAQALSPLFLLSILRLRGTSH